MGANKVKSKNKGSVGTPCRKYTFEGRGGDENELFSVSKECSSCMKFFSIMVKLEMAKNPHLKMGDIFCKY